MRNGLDLPRLRRHQCEQKKSYRLPDYSKSRCPASKNKQKFVDTRPQPLNNRREELRPVPNPFLLPRKARRMSLDLPRIRLKEERLRFNQARIRLNLTRMALDMLLLKPDVLQIKPELPQIMSCLEQITAHPPQTRPCLRFISCHGG